MPTNDYKEIINSVIEGFNFETVVEVMKDCGLTLNSNKPDTVEFAFTPDTIPTVEQLKAIANKLLVEAVTKGRKLNSNNAFYTPPVYIANHQNLQAIYTKYNENFETLRLQFVLDDNWGIIWEVSQLNSNLRLICLG